MFDGIVSAFRSYSPTELREMIADIKKESPELKIESYKWEIGRKQCGILWLVSLYYCIGVPESK